MVFFILLFVTSIHLPLYRYDETLDELSLKNKKRAWALYEKYHSGVSK
ncbi:hypothetical protein F0310_05435 (plasmid) [Borrelia sp. A-FGy1]|nr:hypothetical protein F0310_05435 [Borrelia sp. A-FGy1]